MKGSNATSAETPNAAKRTPADGVRPSDSSPTPTAEAGADDPISREPIGGFPLSGPSRRPDPRTHAYRADLADASLAGIVIASHYALPLSRTLKRPTELRDSPNGDFVLSSLEAGEVLQMLDCAGGWAWGYAGPDRLVGYVDFRAL